MKYEFFKDELGTIWFRDCIEIEADSYNEAVEKVKKLADNDALDEEEILYSEALFDTWNPISVKDNDGYNTMEVQCADTGSIIYRNSENSEDLDDYR